ncbi:MAG: TonB-dependent copper receptor [Gammaproteobacteria bacterium]|jgi:iron complex outermembrane recepter protein
MQSLFRVTPLVLGMLMATSATAETLSPIIVQDDILINPNYSEPEEYTRNKVINADGGEFLRQINGVNMSRFGGRGLEPIIRGQSQTQLNVLLDGAYVQGGCPNRMDPPSSWAALETYEKVVVIRGVQTLQYGGGGSGGTVLFERDTRALAEEKGIHGRVSAAAGTNGMQYDLLADVVASGEKGYVRFFTEFKDNDNYEDGDGNEVRSAFEHKQGGVVLGYTPTEDRLIELTIERNEFKDALYPGSGMDSPEESGTFYKLRYLDKPDIAWVDAIKAEVYFSDIDHVMDNFSLRTPPEMMGVPMLRETDTTSETSGGRFVLTSTTSNTVWNYGIDLQRNVRNATLFNMNMTPPAELFYLWPDADIQQLGIFAEATTAVDDRRRLVYGLRVDRVDASAGLADSNPNPAMPMYSANMAYSTYYGTTAEDQTETNVGGLLRYEQDLRDDITLFAGLSRTVRTADATERYMNKWSPDPTQRWVGNPFIEPEKHHQVDFGMAWRGLDSNVTATLFYDDVDDYILRDYARGQTGILLSDDAQIYRNVDAELYGLELEGTLRLRSDLELTAALAYVHATNTTDDRPIAQTPPLGGKLQLDYFSGRWTHGARVRFADAQDRIDPESPLEVGETPGWGVFDLYGSYLINDTFSLRWGIDNLFDKTYAEHASRANLMDLEAIKVNEPGRVAWLKVTAEF